MNLKIKKDIACVILAAGAGRRFGMPKWQAEYEGKTFFDIITDKVFEAGISDIACVIRKDSIPNIENIKYAVNQNPECGMFSSLFYGINLFPDKAGYVIIPVDHPFFESRTLIELCSVFLSQGGDKVIKPVYSSRAGHPIIIPTHLATQIPENDYVGGLRKFIDDNNTSVHNLEVDDSGVLRNINKIDDLVP